MTSLALPCLSAQAQVGDQPEVPSSYVRRKLFLFNSANKYSAEGLNKCLFAFKIGQFTFLCAI